jgi:hypothetical protein
MAWEHSPALQHFERLRSDWDRLNQASHDHLLLDSRFVGPALRCFGDDDVLLAVDADSQSMALVRRTGPGIWETFQPSQAPLGLMVVAKSAEPRNALSGLLSSLPGLALQLGVLQQDPEYSVFGLLADPQLERLDYIRTPNLPLRGTYDDYWNSRSGNLRHNISRQLKRLAEKGRQLELVVRKAPGEMADAIREYGRLESAGWKGQEGTAVSEDNSQGRFYREVFEGFAETGQAWVYQLVLDGAVIASDLCLVHNGMMVVLKTAYDESIPQTSPALLMRQKIICQLYEENTVRVVEFYGRVLDWHLKWTDQVRTMYHINCFRNRVMAELRGAVKRLA